MLGFLCSEGCLSQGAVVSVALHGGGFVSSLCCLVMRDFEALGAEYTFLPPWSDAFRSQIMKSVRL